MTSRAVFLDRDGTLIEDKGYICHFREVEIFPFSLSALRKLMEHRFRIVIVTNQSAIARGICTEQQVVGLHRELQAYFSDRGVTIDAVYFSPYLENAPVRRYRRQDPGRKPGPGMILQAAAELAIDLGRSWLIGDSVGDVAAGRSAGCRTALVMTGNGRNARLELENTGKKPDLQADNLLAAVEAICRLSVS